MSFPVKACDIFSLHTRPSPASRAWQPRLFRICLQPPSILPFPASLPPPAGGAAALLLGSPLPSAWAQMIVQALGAVGRCKNLGKQRLTWWAGTAEHAEDQCSAGRGGGTGGSVQADRLFPESSQQRCSVESILPSQGESTTCYAYLNQRQEPGHREQNTAKINRVSDS